jgi:hypothetical protein
LNFLNLIFNPIELEDYFGKSKKKHCGRKNRPCASCHLFNRFNCIAGHELRKSTSTLVPKEDLLRYLKSEPFIYKAMKNDKWELKWMIQPVASKKASKAGKVLPECFGFKVFVKQFTCRKCSSITGCKMLTSQRFLGKIQDNWY